MLRRKSVIAIGRILLLLAPWAFIAYLFRAVDAVWGAFEDASLAPMVGGLLLTLVGLVSTASAMDEAGGTSQPRCLRGQGSSTQTPPSRPVV